MTVFRGAFVAIVTPFTEEGIDEQGLRDLIEFQIEAGTHGIVPCGTTGESATMSHEEHHRVVEITIDQVKGRVPVLAGTGSNSTAEAIDLTRHAKEAGADGVLMVTPYYNKPSQEGLYQHYKSVAEAVDIPIVLYNVPGRTSCNLLPATVAIGGAGVISVTSNIAPADMAAMMDAALAGDFGRARELHYRLFPLMQAMFLETNPVPVKTAVALMGKIANGRPRLPLCPMSEANLAKLQAALRDYGLI